jgi:hypothetical protein
LPDELIRGTLKSFHEGKEKKLYIYIDGFGGLFVASARPTTGFTMGYETRRMQFGKHDHVTVLYGAHGLKGLHRKVFDATNCVCMTYDPSYFVSQQGLKKLFEDMGQRKDMGIILKIVYTFVFRLAHTAYTQGEEWAQKATLLSAQEAEKRGMKSPCLYVRSGFLQRIFLLLLSRIIYVLAYYNNLKFGAEATTAFKEQRLPWGRIAKSRAKM